MFQTDFQEQTQVPLQSKILSTVILSSGKEIFTSEGGSSVKLKDLLLGVAQTAPNFGIMVEWGGFVFIEL